MVVSEGDKGLSLDISQGCDITKGRKKLMVECGVVVLQKYSLAGGYFPEIALLLAGASWAVQIRKVFSRLDELENRMNQKHGTRTTNPSAN